MAKLGIVTFHRAHNYGAVLQCFALQETLKNLGADVEVIDYKCNSIKDAYWNGCPKISLKYPIKTAKSIVKSLLYGLKYFRRYYCFDTFIKKKLNLSKSFSQNNFSELCTYNALVYGSDQIWNSSITHNDDFYFGKGFDGIKVAYSASGGKDEVNIKTHESQLQQFKAIGVREESIAKRIENFLTKEIRVTIDPTLLLKAYDWIKYLNLNNRILQEKYVLVYPLRERTKTVDIANKLANKTGVKLVEIGAHITRKKTKYRHEYVSPIDFVSLIYHADYVITNSFHGTVFSIIFQKNFYTIRVNDGEDGRSENLLKGLYLMDRMIEIDSEITPITPDYSATNKLLEQYRKNSIEFLKESLNL